MKLNTILITGAAGFIGSHLVPSLKDKYPLALYDYHSDNDSVKFLDVTKVDNVKHAVYETRPKVVVHLAGLKNLNYCEEHPEDAFLANAESAKFLAEACSAIGARIILLSSDYVFEGNHGYYREKDKPNPATIYGKSKYEAEKYVQSICSNHIILRSSAIYGPGGKFFDWVTNSLWGGLKVEAFNDAYFTPTYIGDVIWAIECMITGNYLGVFHVAGPDALSRYAMALEICHWLGFDSRLIIPTSVVGSGLVIARNSALVCEETSSILNRKFIGIKEGIKMIVKRSQAHE